MLLEARVDLVIEVGVFENVDLLERGYYRVKVGLELPKQVNANGGRGAVNIAVPPYHTRLPVHPFIFNIVAIQHGMGYMIMLSI